METTQEIYLHSYLYLKLTKMPCFLIVFYVFSSTKSENKKVEQVLPPGEEEKEWEAGGPNNVYICK
jgi:hypothetical protein